MQIQYQNIVLRDMEERDTADEIRWNTIETDWALWDAPWEMEEELRQFDPEQHRQKELAWLQTRQPVVRLSLEIDTELMWTPWLRNCFEPGRDAGLAVHLAAGFRQVGTCSMSRFGQPVELMELALTREQYLALPVSYL